MYCSKCGKPASKGQNICYGCGAALSEQEKGGECTNTFSTYSLEEQKSKLAAALFGILLGSFGAHNFYLGYKGKAIAQLLITLCTFGLGATITGIWGLIEGIMIISGSITTDAKGIPLKE